jgi:hypothetical protein
MRIALFLTSLMISGLLVAQTKQETIEWINSKIPANPIVYGDFFKASQKTRINQDGTFEIIITDYEVPINPSNPKAETITTLRGNFKDFNPSSVKTRKVNGLLFIDMYCFNGKKCISISQTGKEGIEYDKIALSIGAFSVNENNIEERLKKAFIKLITLSGGKKEVF